MRFFEQLNSALVVVLVLAFILVVNGFLFYRYQSSLSNPTPMENTSVTEDEAAATQGEANDLRVDVDVVDAPAWLSVQEDGETVLNEVAPPGFLRSFEADREVRIQTDDAGAIRVEANGQEIGALGDSGQAGIWDFWIESER
jgi:hypothetical protein